jgi:hypothetical protein
VKIKTIPATLNRIRLKISSMDIKNPEFWFYVVGGISAIALDIGFVTALVSLGLTWRINRQLERDLMDKELQIERVRTDAQKDIEKARTEAKERTETEAARVESEANRKIEEARAQAQSDVAAAGVRQDEIALELRTKAKELADAQRAADEARLALQKHLEEVTKRTNPRTLTPEQMARLVEALREYAREHAGQQRRTRLRVTVQYVIGNDESEQFALQLIAAFREAGWEIFTERGTPAPLAFSGVQTRVVFARGATVETMNELSAVEGAVTKAFRDIGLATWGVSDSSEYGDVFSVDVGSKP